MRRGAAILLVFYGMLASAASAAEPRSISSSVWHIARDQVTLRVAMPVAEAQRTVAPGLPPPSTEQLAAYILEHFGVQTSGSACDAIDQGYDIGRVNGLAAGSGLYGFEIIFRCPSSTRLVLTNTALFDRMPQHVDYARIEVDGRSVREVFTAQRRQLNVAVGAESAGSVAYASLGAKHIVHSLDRICFLLGLIFLARVGRDLLIAAAGLLLGYLGSAGILAINLVPRMPVVEAALGLMVALCAAQWLAVRVPAPRPLALILATTLLVACVAVSRWAHEMAWMLLGSAIFSGSLVVISARRRDLCLWVLPVLFGCLDGVVLWGDYARLHLWRALSSSTLLSFNAGALLTELGIMALFFAAMTGWARLSARPAFDKLAADIAVTALAGMGAFWLLIQLKG